jgi:nitroreductase
MEVSHLNETLKNIRERYSCRSFNEQLPSDELLAAVAQAATQSPSGMNRQFWHIIVVANNELIAEMEQEAGKNLRNLNESFHQHIMSQNGNLFYNAPCMVFFAAKTAEPPGAELIDLGVVAQTTVLAATSLGLASLHCGNVAFAFAGTKNEYFKKRLGFPVGYECGMAVLLGYAKSNGTPHEPDQSKISYIR